MLLHNKDRLVNAAYGNNVFSQKIIKHIICYVGKKTDYLTSKRIVHLGITEPRRVTEAVA